MYSNYDLVMDQIREKEREFGLEGSTISCKATINSWSFLYRLLGKSCAPSGNKSGKNSAKDAEKNKEKV